MLLLALVHIRLFQICGSSPESISDSHTFSTAAERGREEPKKLAVLQECPQGQVLFRQACNFLSFEELADLWWKQQAAEGWDWKRLSFAALLKKNNLEQLQGSRSCRVVQCITLFPNAPSYESWGKEKKCNTALTHCSVVPLTETFQVGSLAVCYHRVSKWIILTTATKTTQLVPNSIPGILYDR